LLENITQCQQAEDALRWNTGFLAAQANTLIDGLLVTDQQGRILLQNQAFSDLFKLPLSIAEDKDHAKQIVWTSIRTRNPEQFVATAIYLHAHPNEISRDEIELKDGRMLDFCTSPVIHPDGTCYGRLWTFRDITEGKRAAAALRASQRRQTEIAQELADHKQNEQRFRLALEREQKSSQMKSLFVRMASREFRTPLSVITMVAEMLDGDPDTLSDAERSEQLKEIQSAVGRMIQMMNDFPIHGSYTSRIWECKEGKGTTVRIQLPAGSPGLPAASQPPIPLCTEY
jgi:PAS domain S-box-containing protein